MRNCNPLRKPNSLPRSWGSEACGNKSISLPFNSVLMVRDERQSHPAPTARRCFTAIAHPVSLRSSKVLANDSLSRIVIVRSALRQTALQKPSQTCRCPSSDLVKEFSPNQNSEKAKSPLPSDENTVLSTGATWSIPIHNKSATLHDAKKLGLFGPEMTKA
jgi:hypothetical protein